MSNSYTAVFFKAGVWCIVSGIIGLLMIPSGVAAEPTLHLRNLIDEALATNPEILMSKLRTVAADHRIPQAQSLADPMIMIGYQNATFSGLTYPDMADSQFMFSASQMLPFPGKLALKGELATQEKASLQATTDVIRLATIRVISELFYDLFFSYKNLDIIQDRSQLFARLEEAAATRYASGMGPLQDVVMAQTEKYMLLEKETMQRQKIISLEAMLNNIIGRSGSSPLGVPAEPLLSKVAYSPDEALILASKNSPVIEAKQKMVSAADAKVRMAEKEYYPDFTVTGTVADKGPDFDDMWSITTNFNVPIYYQTKQREAVFEAKAKLREAQQDLVGAQLMLAATLKDNYAMTESSEKLMELYKGGLIPKTYQDFDLAMNNYMNGRGEAFSVINRLKSLIDLELLYWERFTDREKAIARIETTIGIEPTGQESRTAQESSQ